MYRINLLRVLMMLSLLGLNLFATGHTASVQKEAMTKKDAAKNESPFYCNVAGLNAEQRQRYMVLVKKLSSGKQEVRELKDGYAFRFSADSSTVQDLAEFIIYERLCCPFFDFELAVEREGGPAWLRLKGREGVKAFIRSEFGIK